MRVNWWYQGGIERLTAQLRERLTLEVQGGKGTDWVDWVEMDGLELELTGLEKRTSEGGLQRLLDCVNRGLLNEGSRDLRGVNVRV